MPKSGICMLHCGVQEHWMNILVNHGLLNW